MAIKSLAKDGYQAVQLGFGQKKLTRALNSLKRKRHPERSRPNVIGQKVEAPRYLKEVDFPKEGEIKVGDQIIASQVFSPGDLVNVTGTSKGKGFTGVVKRWGFAGGPKTHGQSDRLRSPGAIGQGTDPGRVHKGKKMPGHHGQKRITLKNLLVAKVDEASHQLWLKGQVPGSFNSLLLLKKVGQDKNFKGLFVSKAKKSPQKVSQAKSKSEP